MAVGMLLPDNRVWRLAGLGSRTREAGTIGREGKIRGGGRWKKKNPKDEEPNTD